MNRDIPGYYYDAEKKKYFKIEKSSTAPTGAAWSSEAVQRRAHQDRASKAARQRASILRHHIKRSRGERDAVSSGLLARELGLGRSEDGHLGAAAWAAGVEDKGRVPFAPSFAGARYGNMPCFYVSGDDEKTGLGVAYVCTEAMDGESVIGTYIPTDDNGRIHFEVDAAFDSPRRLNYHTEMIRCPQMSSIKYHKPSHRILLTSREPDHSCGLYFFSPPQTFPNDDRPSWLLGETDHYQRLSIRHRLRDDWLVHQSAPAPPSSDLLCVIGTNAGILRVHSNETMAWATPQQPRSSSKKSPPRPQEIFDLDFQKGNHNILLAGGRQSRLWIKDFRTSEAEWRYIHHTSSIAHLRSINEHQVLVAGLMNSMDLYDMRYFKQKPNGAKPLLRFPEYRNAAHFHTGFDVCPELNVVANAQDNGTVKLFSLRTGQALRSPRLQNIQTDTPIRAMMFQSFPREHLPSLFVGVGAELRKYSFGALHLDDEA